MSHSHRPSSKHKRKPIDDSKYHTTSRSNVFERLGENKKEEHNWQGNVSKPDKSHSRSSRIDERDRSEQKVERWPSSNREQPPPRSSSKHTKKKLGEYNDDFKSNRAHHSGSRQQMRDDIDMTPMKKHRSPPIHSPSHSANHGNEYPRGRKRKQKSPPASPISSSVSPPSYPSRQDIKRQRYKSPSPQQRPQHHHRETEYIQERGRSRERKERKPKELVKIKEQPREVKSSRSYDSYKEIDTSSAEYRDNSSDFRHKKHHRGIEVSSQSYKEIPDQKRSGQYKQRKHYQDVAPQKKSHGMLHREIMDIPVEEKQLKYKLDSGKNDRHRQHRIVKEEKVYTSDENVKVQHKKSKRSEALRSADVKPKKKGKNEREEGGLNPRYNAPLSMEREGHDRRSTTSTSHSPPQHKTREPKYSKNEPFSEPESDGGMGKKSKLKKKKKQRQEEEVVEHFKKKKIKQPKLEEHLPPRKKSLEHYEEESKDKSKRQKKRKRTHDESMTSQSGSASEEMQFRQRKHIHAERAETEWRTVDDIDDPPTRRSYKKDPSYDVLKERGSPIESKPRHSRSKIEKTRRGTPESSSSRSASRPRRSPPILPKSLNQRRERSVEREEFNRRDAAREEKHVREDTRNDRRVREQIQTPPHHREQSYMRPKQSVHEERRVEKYNLDRPIKEIRYAEHHIKDNAFYDNKKTPAYHEKRLDLPYENKDRYNSRNEDTHISKKKMRYDGGERRDEYDIESRKPRGDSRILKEPRPKSDMYAENSRSAEFREFRDSQPPAWQGDQGRKVRDPAPEFGGGPQRMASWVGGREGAKLRIEAREPEVSRDSREPRQPRLPRVEKQEQRIPRMEPRDHREVRQDARDVRDLQDTRERHSARQDVIEPRREKWVQERPKPDHMEVKHGENRYSNNRSASRDRSSQFSEPPAFYREVRRSGENRHLDLGIEVTIRDDGGRASVEFDNNKKHRLSPARKVSSYHTSRSRERPGDKMHREGSISLHRSDSEPRSRHEHKLSPRDNSEQRYHRRGNEPIPYHGHPPRSDSRDKSARMVESKQRPSSGFRNEGSKSFKYERSRSAVHRDRSRDSSAADRERSRDTSTSDRERPRGSPRGSQHSQRGEKPDKGPSKSLRTQKGSSKSSSDRHRRETKPQKKSEVKEKEIQKSAADVLDVDWTGLSSPKKKSNPADMESGSILKRFTPGNVLLGMGISSKLLPPEMVEKIRRKCEYESDKVEDKPLPLILDRGLGALNRAESLRQKSWLNAFASRSSRTARLTSYSDASYRQSILGLNEDLRFQIQPPQIINAKTYASSIKHYLNKTKLVVEAR